ncbi:D-glucuronyl C5-epimerase family protein [Candidatus Latescibacterota bacterium]
MFFVSKIMSRFGYLKRIVSAYVFSRDSNVSFWYTPLETNIIDDYSELGKYYMNFVEKTKFRGLFDADGIPMLDYKGNIGIQYNPNSIAQYALGYYDLFLDTRNFMYEQLFLKQADWFVNNVRFIDDDIGLWEYNFDFEYHEGLKAPWRSALAQGQGISVLVRAYSLTKNEKYLTVAAKSFKSFERGIDDSGGVTYIDKEGYFWFEELIFDPPTHVLNGFIWALWGIYDYYLVTKDEKALHLFREGTRTLEDKIEKYDIGFWSIYHLLPTKLKMIASTYYQRLHIVQLEAMYNLTGKKIFKEYANKWKVYYSKWHYRCLSICYKVLFKIIYY